MAHVFASSHPVLDRRVAIKVLKKEACADPHFVTRFLEDARAAHGFDHPNIVRVLDVDDSGEQPFIVMELIDGTSLDGWLPAHRLEVGEAVRIARDVAQALQIAHEAGLVHRDVKPSNILIDRNTAAVKLTDFGAAKRERPGAAQLTEMGQRIGTPRYMAPEQIDGRTVDTRADLFALGATLYELLANKPAFEGNTVSAVFHAILFSEPRPLGEVRPDAPPELVALVERLLAKAPEARPASAREVAAALEPFVTGAAPAAPQPAMAEPPPATAEPPPDPTERTVISGGAPASSGAKLAPRNRLVPAVAGIALLVVAIGAWWLLKPGTTPEPDQPEVAVGEPAAPEPAEETPAAESATAPEPAQTEPATEAATAALQPEAESEPAAEPAAEDAPEPAALPETEAAAQDEAAAPLPPADAPEPADVPESADAPAPDEPTTTAQLTPGTEEAPPAAPEPLTTLECAPGSGPGCALAAEALNTLQTPAIESPGLMLNRPDGIYIDQDYLVIETELPPDLGGYLYLDVLTDAGNVYHLLPEPMREDNEVQAGGAIRVGVEASERRDGVRFWQVGEPFGEGYLLAVVSEKPLYQGLRPIEETIAEYQDVLLEALADPQTGRKSAQVERLEFRPRGG